MRWYKIDINAGPGHQSRSTEYWKFDNLLTKDDLFDEINERVENKYGWTGQVQFHAQELDELPINIKKQMIKYKKYEIKRL